MVAQMIHSFVRRRTACRSGRHTWSERCLPIACSTCGHAKK